MNTLRSLLLFSAALLLLALPFAACTTQSARHSEPDSIIGRPPPPEEDDPFFARALPAEAVPAEPSGRIAAPRRDEDVSAAQEPVRGPVDLPEVAVEEKPVPEVVREAVEEVVEEVVEEPQETREVAARVPVEVPREEVEIPRGPRKNACFSCVRICPLDDTGRPRCSDDSEDLICGWGSHTNIEEAQKTARAHCDATLDMARQMPTYSEIGGQCPVASCQ